MSEPTETRPRLPEAPIDRIVGPLERFLHVEAAGGIVLLACTAIALVLANSPVAAPVHAFWHTEVGITIGGLHLAHPLQEWINDGLMAVFFFVIGLEVKRELVLGELRDAKRAVLPGVAALGGMVVPAGIYLALQAGGDAVRGWGIPMATDIAFVVGCVALLGTRVPHSLRVILLSLAIVDDIGAILVIALGYSAAIHAGPLLFAASGVLVIVALTRLGVRAIGVYAILGFIVWAAFLGSGIHATIAGVILGLLTPARPYLRKRDFTPFLARAQELMHDEEWQRSSARAEQVLTFQRATREMVSPLEYLERILHPWVGFVIMPIFALANAGVPFHLPDVAQPIAVAIALSLIVGKPVGVVLFSWVATRTGLARLPEGVSWAALAGGGALAGIGFTMALFIASLALAGAAQDIAKVGVLVGSVLAALAGITTLRLVLPRPASATR